MPINKQSWHDGIPRSDERIRFWENFSADKLKANEIECGDAVLAKIPKIDGMISRRKKQSGNMVTTYIELILSRTYDKDKKQSRNKRVIIGTDISHIYPGMMMINDKYHDYFDRDGNLIHNPEQPESETNTTQTNPQTRTQNNNQPQPDSILQDLAQTNTAVALQFQAETTEPEKPQITNQTQTQPTAANTPFDEPDIHQLLNKFKDTLLIQSQAPRQTAEGDKHLEPKQGTPESEEENLTPEEDEAFMAAMRESQHRKDRLDYLNSLLIHYSGIIDEQAKRKPDNPLTLYQIRRINALLSEIKDMLSSYENQEYLLLAEEPDPDSDTPPMTSLDMSILLGSYYCTLTAYRLGRLWTTGQPLTQTNNESEE